MLIAAAEIGDKSQLVCMTLASKHRGMPVALGAIFAFVLLNSLAVIFGAAISQWLPDFVVALSVAVLFAIFGLIALFSQEEEEQESIREGSGHGIFFTAFFLITVAEFGDKTQLAVVGLSSTMNVFAVWLGATLALIFTSVLGVLAGRTFFQSIPLHWIHKVSGLIFIALAGIAAVKAFDLAGKAGTTKMEGNVIAELSADYM